MQLYSLQDFKKDIMVPISGAPPVDVALNRLKRAPADACVEHEGKILFLKRFTKFYKYFTWG